MIHDLFSPLPVSDSQLTRVETDDRRDLAYARRTYARTVRAGDCKPTPDRGESLTIWRRQSGGRWLLSRNPWNSDLAAP